MVNIVSAIMTKSLLPEMVISQVKNKSYTTPRSMQGWTFRTCSDDNHWFLFVSTHRSLLCFLSLWNLLNISQVSSVSCVPRFTTRRTMTPMQFETRRKFHIPACTRHNAPVLLTCDSIRKLTPVAYHRCLVAESYVTNKEFNYPIEDMRGVATAMSHAVQRARSKSSWIPNEPAVLKI